MADEKLKPEDPDLRQQLAEVEAARRVPRKLKGPPPTVAEAGRFVALRDEAFYYLTTVDGCDGFWLSSRAEVDDLIAVLTRVRELLPEDGRPVEPPGCPNCFAGSLKA